MGAKQTQPDEQMASIVSLVERIESYASEIFNDEYFTSITKWTDGDYRVECRSGKGHKGMNSAEEAYRQDYEIITYHHNDGDIVYADRTRFIDARFTETHEQRVLESASGGNEDE